MDTIPHFDHSLMLICALLTPACDQPAEIEERAECIGVPNPLDFGPECCDPGTIVQPQQGQCNAEDVSPRLDASGVYQGDQDRPNTLEVGPGVLQLCAVYVIDNGEGDDWPHGPHGNLYIDVFAPDEPLDASEDGADQRRIRDPRVLRGPHNTHDDTDEWLDDEVLRYQEFGVLEFDADGPAAAQAVLRVWESDSQSEDGSWGRRNDVMGMELIDRAATEAGAVWVDFHKYTNDHPRIRTNEVAMQLLVLTGGACPEPEL
jgi:hypothetical protein